MVSLLPPPPFRLPAAEAGKRMGKISIPAEILSKPGKLSEVEMQMVRRHPQAAFEILKEIDLIPTAMIGEPFDAQNVPEFINKVKNEQPIPPRRWNRNISNKHENIDTFECNSIHLYSTSMMETFLVAIK